MSQKKRKSLITMQLNTKLNIFLKFTKTNILNTFLRKEFKKELNTKLLKNPLFTNQYNKFNKLSKLFNNQFKSYNNQFKLFNNQFKSSNNQSKSNTNKSQSNMLKSQ
jgi:hypothetical protein